MGLLQLTSLNCRIAVQVPLLLLIDGSKDGSQFYEGSLFLEAMTDEEMVGDEILKESRNYQA